ncbi:glycoside hydrolase family 2 protein [Pseudacidobacterium ailaaui]|uniref:glycoside hydrolase family 2 protein n=1 Tax=Pseudacidobacterium ailaaui TaxID=1382359 RepID=UPI00047ADD62|nr:glycoside hydrolase family 2 TIM barrel-domain containing protein [Pseudacidobacterium ailaaui]
MDRRDFMKASGALLAGAAVARHGFAQHEKQTHGGRLVLAINRGWRYHPKFVEGGHEAQFDDSGFDRVVVPHTNVRLPWHGFDDKEYEFVSLYRRKFRLPAEARGKHVFVDFEGVMTASTVWINGQRLGEYKGGYTPFSFELTQHVDFDGENVLAVDVDSTERPDIPPFGYRIDYLTFGGIYREVALRIVPSTFIENIFAQPKDVLSGSPSLDVLCYVQSLEPESGALQLEALLLDGDHTIAKATQTVSAPGAVGESVPYTVTFAKLKGIELWDLNHPKLYTVKIRMLRNGQIIDEDSRRTGFRHAEFTDHGFELNGRVIKLRGLDRHQTFPFVGQAMPARVQRRDAYILRKQLHCNIVRTSHYPQSRHFLDACDEYGLLVLEEIPGWQHIGDQAWQDLSVDNVSRMIRRDWNHPSIVLWGVRINESRDNHDFYTRTNAMAHRLDPTRQTGGIRYFQESEFLEDVFTMNDFGWPLKPPNHPRYLNTEFVGHTYPVKTVDDDERHREHTIRHARVHDQLASNPQYAGGIGWCAFDYNTHDDFGAGDRICYHGVMDIFREPKPAAGFYKSQCDPEEEIVLEPAFHWASSDEATRFSIAMVCSNCDHLKWYVRNGDEWKLAAETDPDHEQFPHLKYAPFSLDLTKVRHPWGDLRIDGYLKGKQVISRTFSGRGVDRRFSLRADDQELLADGADTTRVVMRVTDEFDAIRPYANDAIVLTLEGPAELIGDNPFALFGGQGAVWVRAKEEAGTVRLTARHPRLGTQTVEIAVRPAAQEQA